MKFVVIHGAFGNPEEHWLPKLKEKLESFGQVVEAPKFPVEDWDRITALGPKVIVKKQELKNWLSTFKKTYDKFKKGEGLCFIGHSLGAVFILHAVEKFNIQLDSAIFVSPFMDKLNNKWQFDVVNKSFYKTDFDFEKLKKLIPISYVLYSDNDPYVAKSHATLFAKSLDSSFIYIKQAGHLNNPQQLSEFPLVLELCKTRIALPSYEEFISHRSKLFSVDYVGKKTEEVIYLNPKDVFGYGKFQFRNLQKCGFCTFITSNSDFDPESTYMIEARKAAKRIKNITRVFVISKLSDLNKKDLLKQINLDFAAGIEVYFCPFKEIAKKVKEPDFGIWDDDYVCYVSFDKNNSAVEVRLSSRIKDMAETYKWKKIVLDHAVRIKNPSTDMKRYIRKYS
ncbi:alpha/beta hydrolase [Patescibacteria group bacterium]|nr:alpha/beta hydrolase [Patescibacteria group bacterium]